MYLVQFLDLSSDADPDPFHFGIPDPLNETNPGIKKSVEIMENSDKNQPRTQNYHTLNAHK